MERRAGSLRLIRLSVVRLILGSSLRVGPTPSTLADPILCTDAESSVEGIPVPVGCTGF